MNQPTALITDALTGIGLATTFAKAGANAVVSGQHEAAGAALAMERRTPAAKAELVKADIANEAEARNRADSTVCLFVALDSAVNKLDTTATARTHLNPTHGDGE